MDRETLLKKVGIFSSLGKKPLKRLSDICYERSFNKGEVLVKQGDQG
jgi:hypothetical protein